MKCSACDGALKKAASVKVSGVYECRRCGGLNADGIYLGESYGIVKPFFDAPGACKPEDERYFDFTCLGSKGITRRHGWYNPATGYITQVG